MTFPFWSRPCRGCDLRWPRRKWTRYDGYGRCFVHENPYSYDDADIIICSDMNWFQRHPYLMAFSVLMVLGWGVIISQIVQEAMK